jgi:hypothetical protein
MFVATDETVRSAPLRPWQISTPLAPVVFVTQPRSRTNWLLVALTVAAVTHVASVTTVPEPHPETVQSLALNVNVGVAVTLKIPADLMIIGWLAMFR